MFEATKTRLVRGEAFAQRYFAGTVLDIGCGPDLVVPHARAFDVEHGDANEILKFLPPESFDCVHSSHCLEHMRNPADAIRQWWALVRPGGFLILVVPHEDLYEQRVWPSAFNSDHKATFRLDASSSWSPVSYDIRELATALPNSVIIDCAVQDHAYDRRLMRSRPMSIQRFLLQIGRRREAMFRALMQRGLPVYRISQALARTEHALGKPIDQTQGDALAQIQIIVQKLPASRDL